MLLAIPVTLFWLLADVGTAVQILQGEKKKDTEEWNKVEHI